MRSEVEQWSRETGTPVRYITRPVSTTETLMLWQQDWAAHTPDVDVYFNRRHLARHRCSPFE